jgi:hypothetical protein
MYDGSKACVRVNGSLSEWFEVKRGVRQGCVMSPWLFNVFMDKCVRMASRDGRGIRVDDADDALLLAESEEELQNMIVSLQESTSSMDKRVCIFGKTVSGKWEY